jgi:hypothetical protein
LRRSLFRKNEITGHSESRTHTEERLNSGEMIGGHSHNHNVENASRVSIYLDQNTHRKRVLENPLCMIALGELRNGIDPTRTSA